jgi:hypothetical protein
MFELLIALDNVDLTVKNTTSDFNLLHCAISRNHTQIIEYLSKNCRELFDKLLNAPNEDGWLPIHYVQDPEMFELLIALDNVDLTVKNTTHNSNLLHCSIINYRTNFIEYLSKNYKELFNNLLSTPNENGWLPRHYVRNPEMFDLLLNLKAYPPTKNPLSGFIVHNAIKLVRYLLERHKNFLLNRLKLPSKNGWLPSHRTQSIEMLELLIELGVDPKEKNTKSGANLLHSIAEDSKNPKSYNVLIAFVLALSEKKNELFNTLAKSPDKDGNFPASYAEKNTEMFNLLNKPLEELK